MPTLRRSWLVIANLGQKRNTENSARMQTDRPSEGGNRLLNGQAYYNMLLPYIPKSNGNIHMLIRNGNENVDYTWTRKHTCSGTNKEAFDHICYASWASCACLHVCVRVYMRIVGRLNHGHSP